MTRVWDHTQLIWFCACCAHRIHQNIDWSFSTVRGSDLVCFHLYQDLLGKKKLDLLWGSFPFGNRGILKQLSTLPALKTRRQDDWISIHCTLLSLNDLIYLRFQHCVRLLISMHVHPISNGHNGFSEEMLHVLKEDLNEMLKTAICSVPLSQRQ